MLMLMSLYRKRETHLLSLLKGDAPPLTRISLYLHNQRRAILTSISLLPQQQVRLRS
jgi:hypothetical protein